jgi:hypothetical protein
MERDVLALFFKNTKFFRETDVKRQRKAALQQQVATWQMAGGYSGWVRRAPAVRRNA